MNGAFQGDDSVKSEVKTQISFSIFPLLHTTARSRALLIGLGTGVSAMTTRDAGFEHVDVVERSADIVRLGREHFGGVNGRVVDAPNVRVYTTDGRNFMALQRTLYDLVEVQTTSPWFSGASSLYSQNFYEIVADRLGPRGVLEQWIQLHHMDVEGIVSVLGTVKSVFPNVWLYLGGGQGIVVACRHDCRPSEETLRLAEGAPALARELALLGSSPRDLLGRRLLTPNSLDRFLEDMASGGLRADDLVSTDDNLLLEYETPRNNVMSYEGSMRLNVGMLARYAPSDPREGTKLEASATR
jgi:hypothetical protein